MDGARIELLQYKGYRIAAKKVGLPYNVFRPTSADNPLDAGNKVLTAQPAAFTPHGSPNFQFSKPSDYRDATFHGLFDGAVIRVRDYFVGAMGPFVVVSMDHIMPPLCVQCNRTISVKRVSADGVPCGVSGYSGQTPDNETTVMTNWPASVLEAGRGKGGTLPGDPGASTGWEILLPSWPGILLDYGDVITDDIGRTYGVRTAELSDLGWRIVASEMVL